MLWFVLIWPIFLFVLLGIYIYECRQGHSMTRSAKSVSAHLQFSGGGQVAIQDTRKLRFARLAVSWKMSVKSAFWILNMGCQFRFEILLYPSARMTPFPRVMLIGSTLQRSMIERYSHSLSLTHSLIPHRSLLAQLRFMFSRATCNHFTLENIGSSEAFKSSSYKFIIVCDDYLQTSLCVNIILRGVS